MERWGPTRRGIQQGWTPSKKWRGHGRRIQWQSIPDTAGATPVFWIVGVMLPVPRGVEGLSTKILALGDRVSSSCVSCEWLLTGCFPPGKCENQRKDWDSEFKVLTLQFSLFTYMFILRLTPEFSHFSIVWLSSIVWRSFRCLFKEHPRMQLFLWVCSWESIILFSLEQLPSLNSRVQPFCR